MSGFPLDKIIAVISLLLAIAASLNAYLKNRDNSTEKQYAASRDFGHIKNSLLNLTWGCSEFLRRCRDRS